MNARSDILIRISPEQEKITIEEQAGAVSTRKEVTRDSLLQCFKNSLQTDKIGYHSGFLPLNCLAVWQGAEHKKLVLWHPRLYADVAVYDTPYPNFPIPRMVFGFTVDQGGKVSRCRIGVVADEAPTPETIMFHYPFSNVSEGEGGNLCAGSNEMPAYRKLHKAVNLPAFLLSIPNNMHNYFRTHNKLGLQYRDLMEHLKDKDPSYYYSDILIPNGHKLQDFIDKM